VLSRKKKKKSSLAAEPAAELVEEDEVEDIRTAYEKKWDQQIVKMESKNAKSKAKNTHRQRIDDFNEKLSKLSEHNDIPRVSGGA